MSHYQPDPLLASLAAGREEAFAALYDRYGPQMYRVALALLGRREDAEDAVQDAFASLVRSRGRLARAENLAAYLFATLRRAAGRVGKQRSREPAVAAELALIAEQDAGPQPESPHADRLRRALRSLPEEQRTVIALKIEGELTFEQIAEATGVGVNTTMSRYRYALEKLRGWLGAASGESDESRSLEP